MLVNNRMQLSTVASSSAPIEPDKLHLAPKIYATKSPCKNTLKIKTAPPTRFLSSDKQYGLLKKSKTVWVPVTLEGNLKFQRLYATADGYKCRKQKNYTECNAYFKNMGPVEEADKWHVFQVVTGYRCGCKMISDYATEPQSKSARVDAKKSQKKSSPAKIRPFGFGSSSPRFP